MKKKKARKTGNSTDPLERVRQKVLVRDPLKRPFHRKKRTPLGNVRRENCDLLSRREVFFFWGDEKPKKVRDSQDPEIPIELGFQKVRYPARNGEPRNSSDGHRRLRENPENRCDPQKETLTRSSPSHGTFAKEEEWHRNANLSPCPKKV
jgi:hypothetical protein